MCPNFGGQPCTIVLSLDHSGLAVPQRRSSADIPTRPWYYTYREDGKPTQAVDPKAASAVNWHDGQGNNTDCSAGAGAPGEWDGFSIDSLILNKGKIMIIDHIAMYVNDLEKPKDFFVKYFGAVPVHFVRIRCGRIYRALRRRSF